MGTRFSSRADVLYLTERLDGALQDLGVAEGINQTRSVTS